MKPLGLILLVLFNLNHCHASDPDALDYILRSIEHEASIESGLFQCILYDLSQQNAFRNFLGDILQSPRLKNVLKYVVTNGSFENKLDNLPWHPSMLLIHPGTDADYLLLEETIRNIAFVLNCFNPTTKVVVFVDAADHNLIRKVLALVHGTGFTSIVFFDPDSMCTYLFNPVILEFYRHPPAPMYLFTRLRREITGHNLTYVLFTPLQKVDIRTFIDLRWVKETARYLKTEASDYQHRCFGLESLTAFQQCLASKADDINAVDIEIQFAKIDRDIPRGFSVLFTTMLLHSKIAVPRDRPLNVIELMLMPFSWQVWLLLLMIFVVSEVFAQLFPYLFENDPILIAVCGFERRSLHQARQREKIILQSLIVLMFFISHVFETKIVSLMIDRPAIQRIKTLEDLAESDIMFSFHLEINPHFVNDSIIGPKIVNGTHLFIHDKVPGFGLYLLREHAEILEFTAYDYDRMQPWYVVLDCEFYLGPWIYHLSRRNRYLEVFRYIQITLTEVGLLDLWMRQYQYEERPLHHGQRLWVETKSKIDLNFEDMQLAWVVLAFGLGVGVLAILGEIVESRFRSLWKRISK